MIMRLQKGDWVMSVSNPYNPSIAKVKDAYADPVFEGQELVDLVLYSHTGEKIGRSSPALGGPKGFEPACDASLWTRIKPPNFDILVAAGPYSWYKELKVAERG